MGGQGSGRRKDVAPSVKKDDGLKKIFCKLSQEELEFMQDYAMCKGMFFGALCRKAIQEFIARAKESMEKYTVTVQTIIGGECRPTERIGCKDLADAVRRFVFEVKAAKEKVAREDIRLIGCDIDIFLEVDGCMGSDIPFEASIRRPVRSRSPKIFVWDNREGAHAHLIDDIESLEVKP
jgi:predicted ThiF/HesA family dinucleotide-utilizing enzyme